MIFSCYQEGMTDENPNNHIVKLQRRGLLEGVQNKRLFVSTVSFDDISCLRGKPKCEIKKR